MSLIEIPRDRWGRPTIVPLGTDGSPDLTAKLVPYTRVSTMAKSLDDTSNLMTWMQRVTLLGVVRRPDLVTRVAALMAQHEDPNTDFAAKKKLNEIAKEAKEAGGASDAASLGTALHELTEALDAGRDITPFAGQWQPRLDGYADVMSNYEVLDMETFVVNDEVKAAGSFDRLLRCPDGRVRVGDLKTGAHDDNYPLGVSTQIGTYANAHRYDPETGERSELHPDLDTSVGLLIHMPARGEGIRVFPLDLNRGWYAAKYAAGVHEIRKWKAADLRGEPIFSA